MARPANWEEEKKKAQAAQQKAAKASGESQTDWQARNTSMQTAKRERQAREQSMSPIKFEHMGTPTPTKTVNGKTYVKRSVDMNALTDKHAASLAREMATDEERDVFLGDYTKHIRKKSSANYRQDAPTLDEMREMVDSSRRGGVYAQTRSEWNKTMSAFDGLLDISGNAVNMNTASLEEIERAIRFTANDKKRKAMVTALETLTETPGNRFYGVTFDKSNTGKFLESSELTNEDYNDEMEYFRGQFDPIAGAGEANSAIYQELLKGIEESDNSDYVKRQFKDALDEVYTELIGGEIPKAPEKPKTEELEETQSGETEEANTQDAQEPGFIDKLVGWGKEVVEDFKKNKPILTAGEFQFAKQMDKPEEIKTGEWQGPKQRKAPTLQEALADEQYKQAEKIAEKEEDGKSIGEWQGAAQQEKPKAPALQEALADETFMRAFIEKKNAEMSAAGEKLMEVQGPQFKSLFERILEDGEYQAFVEEKLAQAEAPKEVHGPQRSPMLGAQEDNQVPKLIDTIYEKYGAPNAKPGMGGDVQASGSVDLTHDLGKAWFEYKETGRFDELTPETQKMLSELYGEEGVKAWMGILGDSEFSQFAARNEDGTTGQELNNVPPEFLYTQNIGKLGANLTKIASTIYDEEFPAELREDAFMAGIQLIQEANDWAASEVFLQEIGEKNKDLVNIYDEYQRLHGRESKAAVVLNDAIALSAKMKNDEREAQMLSAEEAQRNERQNLLIAREAVISGLYTPEQMELVEKYAPVMDEAARMADPLYKSMMDQMLEEWEFGSNEWMDEQVLSMAEALGGEYTAQTDMDWAARVVAYDFLEDVLRKKTDVAYALGYRSLEAYAYSHGGLTLESLQTEARLEMLKLGSSLDSVDMAISNEAVKAASQYTGSGEGVTAGQIAGAALASGTLSAVGDPIEGFYNWMAATDLRRDGARVKATYDNDYGLFSETQLKADLNAMADGGYFPNDEMAQFVKEYLKAGGNPYELGLMPDDLQFVRKSAVSIKQTRQAYGRWAQRMLNPEQGMAFEVGSAVADNTTRMVLGAVAKSITGNSFVSMLATYGSSSYNEGASSIYEQDAQAIKETGKIPKNTQRWANVMGISQAVATAASEYVTFGKWADNVGRLFNVNSAVKFGMNDIGMSGAMRVWTGVTKFTKAFAGQELDEFKDELVEGYLGDAVDIAVTDLRSTAGTPMDALFSSFKGAVGAMAKADDTLKATFDNAAMIALTTAPMAILGAGGAMKDAMPRTYSAAKQMANGGKAEDTKRFITAMMDEVGNATPEQMDAANKALHDVAVAEEAVVILTSDPEIEPTNKIGAKAQEQADAHATSEENSIAAAEAGRASALAAQERMNSGEINPELVTQVANGVLANAKNSQSVLEHRREKNQKQAEADAAFAEGMKKATAKAEAEVSAREEAALNVVNDLSVMGEEMNLSRNMNDTGFANEAERFSEAIDAWDGSDKGLSFAVGKTSDILKAQGFFDGEIVIQSEKLAKIKKKHPQMTNEVIKQLPSIVNDPVVVMRSNTVRDRITLFGEVFDTDGAPVLAVVSLQPKTNMVTGASFFEINSAYGKNTDPQGFINRSTILYVDKKRAPAWEVSTRLQLPVEPSNADSASTSIVAQTDKNVNSRMQVEADVIPGNGVQKAPYTNMDSVTVNPTQTEGRARTNPSRTYKRLAKSLGIGQAFGTRKLNGLEGRAAGYYEPRAGYATSGTNYASSIEVDAHEIGHHLSHRLGITGTPQMVSNLGARFIGNYQPNQLPSEAFSEFFWRYMLSDDEARRFAGDAFVADFERRLRQEGILRDVKRAQTETRQYMLAETDERIRLMIRDKSDKNKDDTVAERFDEMERHFISTMVDSTRPAEDVNSAVREATGGTIQERMNLRNAALMQSTAPKRAFSLLTQNLTDVNGTIIGAGLRERLEASGIRGNQFDTLVEYMLAKHSLDRDAQDKPVFDRSAITQQQTEDFIAQIERDHPEIATAERAFQEFRHDFMQEYMVATGYMTQEMLDQFERMYPHYVPTYRVKDRGRRGVGGQTYQIRRATGSTEEIVNPIDSFVDMVNTIVAMNLRNETAKTWDRIYQNYEGMGVFGREVTEDQRTQIMNMQNVQEQVRQILDNASVGDDIIQQALDAIGEEQFRRSGTGDVNLPNILTVQMPDGSKRFYEIFDDELFEMFAGTQDSGKSALSILGVLTRGMSMLTTGSNPLFFMRNAMRDYQNSVNYGSWSSNYLTGSMRWLRSAWEVARNSGDYQQYQALGGGGWTRANPNNRRGTEEYRGELFAGYNTSNLGRGLKWGGRELWNAITASRLNEIVEQASRYAEYRFGQHDITTAEGRQEAYLAAQDVTTDFSRKGNSRAASEARMLVPFFNASLQGIYRTGRQFTEAERERAGIRFVKTVINTGLMSALASAWLIRSLDEEEKDEFIWLSDDLKAKHLYIPNFAPDILGEAPMIRIPLSQDPLSYAIHGAVTNVMWNGEGEEWAVGLCAIAQNILDSVNPVGSTILDPIIATKTNRNWYGSNIVPRRMDGWDPTNQYSEETPDAFIEMSRLLDAGTGISISPMMLQYLAEQYTGFVGQIAIPFFTKNEFTGEINGIKAVIQKARNTLTSDPLKSNDVISCVYDNEEFLTTITKAEKNGRPMNMLRNNLTIREAKRAANEAYDLTHKGGAIYDAKKIINDGYDEIDEIEANQSLTDEQKYELTSKVRREMIEAALDANEEMQAFRETYVTGESFLTRFMRAPTIE